MGLPALAVATAVGIAQPTSSAGPSTSTDEGDELFAATLSLGMTATLDQCHEVVKRYPGDRDRQVNIVFEGSLQVEDDTELDSGKARKMAKLYNDLR